VYHIFPWHKKNVLSNTKQMTINIFKKSCERVNILKKRAHFFQLADVSFSNSTISRMCWTNQIETCWIFWKTFILKFITITKQLISKWSVRNYHVINLVIFHSYLLRINFQNFDTGTTTSVTIKVVYRWCVGKLKILRIAWYFDDEHRN